jgi:hypothetical protein
VLFQDNEAGDEGAALWAWDGDSIHFVNSVVTFLRNKADTATEESRIARAASGHEVLGIGGAISIKQPTAMIYFPRY